MWESHWKSFGLVVQVDWSRVWKFTLTGRENGVSWVSGELDLAPCAPGRQGGRELNRGE